MKQKSIRTLLFSSIFLAFFITYAYSHSITALYGGMELLLAAFCYWNIITKSYLIDGKILRYYLVVTVISFLMGTISGDIKSTILSSISISLPLAISVIDFKTENESRDVAAALFFGMMILIAQEFFGIMGEISSTGDGVNSNTYGFLCFMYVSIGFAAFRAEKKRLKKILIGSMILYGGYLGMMSGSRNVILVSAICLVFAILPEGVFRNKLIFRGIYIAVLLYVIFSPIFIEFIFGNYRITEVLIRLTSQFSNKAWSMISRAEYLREVRQIIAQYGILRQVFGTGIVKMHGHNLFNQLIIVYGYFGAILINILYVRIFEMARILISRHNDKFTTGITIALLGIFLLNGADVFLAGAETCSIIPQVFLGIVMCRYRMMTEKYA